MPQPSLRLVLFVLAAMLAVYYMTRTPEPDFLDGDQAEQTPLPLRSDPFGQLDRDGDGFVSRREARQQADLEVRFGALDADEDGRISHTEFRAFEQARPERIQREPDTDDPASDPAGER